jgi:hypothetical protein
VAEWIVGGVCVVAGALWAGDVAGLASGMREANLRPWRGRWSESRGADFLVRTSPLWSFRIYGLIVVGVGVALLVDAAL